MDVSEAVASRRSVRAFLNDPIDGQLVRELLLKAARAPSGGNLQPWIVHALTGARLGELLDLIEAQGPDPEPGYDVYPAGLSEPYRSRRFEVGEALYATISVPREDRPGRLTQFARNARLFGAPVGVFVFIDRQMGPPQWSDLGMFIQTFLLLATERGLATCPQEYWALHAATIERFFGGAPDQRLFCGIALGHGDDAAPINQLRTQRAPADQWCTLHGFEPA